MRAAIGFVSIMAWTASAMEKERQHSKSTPWPATRARRYSASIWRSSRRSRSRPFQSSMTSSKAARSRAGGGVPA